MIISGSIVYAASGTRIIQLAGIEFIDFFTEGQSSGSAGINASALHTSRNDTWIPFPGDNQNYIRGTTHFQYGNVNISDSLCLRGSCIASWPTTSDSAIRNWWRSCYYRDGYGQGWHGSNYCIKTANSIQTLCCPG